MVTNMNTAALTQINQNEEIVANNVCVTSNGSPHEQTVARTQWYLENPSLQNAEIQAMTEFKPDAEYGYLPNGKMYWLIKLQPIVCGNRKNWTLLMVYHDNHPKKKYWGDTINIYPINPTPAEILERLKTAGITTKTIPHTIQDSDGYVHLNVGTRAGFELPNQTVTSAASLLRQAMRWISILELGLIDPVSWADFQGYCECGGDPSHILQTSNRNTSSQGGHGNE